MDDEAKKIVDVLLKCAEWADAPIYDVPITLPDHLREVAKMVSELSACIDAAKWISVKDRLPEYGRYLVVTKKGNAGAKVHTATYNHMGWWTHANFGDITHWMPLPDIPEEENNG